MRFRLPEGCGGIAHAGQSLEPQSDGTVEAAEEAALALAPHGLVPVPLDEPTSQDRPRPHTRKAPR